MHRLFSKILLVLLSIHALDVVACEQNLPSTGARDDVLVIVNNNSRDSCEVGRYFSERRGLGQNNILHVNAPAAFYITWTEFKQLRDQILKNLQQRIAQENPTLTLATCSGYESPYYCPDVINQVSQNTRIRYVVTTKGVPSRMIVDGSPFGGEATVVDNYLKFWLLNYYTTDIVFSAPSNLRARAFDDGRGMRVVNPALDREMILGRIDGITVDTAKALIDRTLSAEANGIFGKVYTHSSQALYNASSGMAWKNYNAGSSRIYSGGTDPWRYQFGMFNETLPECYDYTNTSHYLQKNAATGKTPQQCTVKVSVSPNTASFGTNDAPPGFASSRQPIVDDSLFYMGHLDGQAAGGGSFNSFSNWRRNATCSNTLCESLPLAEQTACRAASVDVYKEIDTRCMGVADGFIGYNYQSYPVSFLHIAPTGWQTGGASNFRQIAAEVRTDSGANDNFSLWFRNTDEIDQPLCYANYDLSQTPATLCKSPFFIYFTQSYSSATTQTSVPATPNQYRVRFKYKAENLSRSIVIPMYLNLTELATGKVVTYDRINATPTIAAGTTEWLDATAILTVNHADTEHNPNWDGTYRNITLNITSNAQFSGAIGLDDFSLALITPAGDVPIPLVNSSFTQGHKEVTTGDHAANYLSRLNGVAFWGSMSHHESGGHSFSTHPLETMIYFLRGLPLGDAVWFAEVHNSGMLYGDPLYSPIAVKLDYLTPSSSNKFVYAQNSIQLKGSAVNGTDPSRVTTSYALSYCAGQDFYICDQQGTWQSTGLSGRGGQRNMSFGGWNTSSLPAGAYTVRLSVTSTNNTTSRSQTYNDYQTLITHNDTSDYDQDGLSDVIELAPGSVTLPNNPDMDFDGLLDGAEVNIYHTNPRSSDSDGDRINDKVEIDNGLNPLLNDVTLDLDGDGVSNGIEIANTTRPNDASSFPALKTVYVDAANGSGIENGSAQNPYTNLNTAFAATIHGDTVRIAAGDYTLTGFLSKRGLRIIGLSPAQTRVTTSTGFFFASGWYEGEISNLAVISPSSGLYVSGSQNMVIRNVSINAVYTSLSIGGSQNISVSNVSLHSDDTGLSISNSRNINIDHCIATGSNAASSSALYYFASISAGTVNIDHCTFTNFDYGISAYDATSAGALLNIRNSIVDANFDHDMLDGLPPLRIQHSLLRNGTFAGTKGNLGGNPQFVNALAGDYHLLPNSPAVATGDPSSALGAEPTGNARVNMGYYGGTVGATAMVDLDSDRLPDGYEVAMGLNPTVSNRFSDTDTDGFTDTVEFWEGTSPIDAALKPANRTYRSGLTYKRKTQTFEGTIKVTNTSTSTMAGPLQVELQNLSVGVTLVNATGMHGRNPYITTAPNGLAPGASVTVPVKYSNPTRVGISYYVRVSSGAF